MKTPRLIGLAITVASAALGVLCAIVIQDVTFGGYVWEAGLAFSGASFVTGVHMTLTAA